MNDTRLPARDGPEQDLSTQLAGWMAREAPPRARPELLASTLARTAAIARPGARRWSLGPLLRPLATPMRLALVVLLIAALSGMAVLGVGSRLLLRAPTTPTPVPSPAPSPASSPLGGSIPLLSSTTILPAGGATIGDVTLGGRGLLAVGSVSSGTGEDAAAWTSTDGSEWLHVSTGVGLANATVMRIAGRGTALVALGFDCPPNPQGTCGPGRAWTSPDGARWTPASTSFGRPSEGGIDYGFQAIVQGGTGYVMVGGADQADPYGGTYLGPVVATSRDGSRWTIQRLSGPGFDRTTFAGVAHGANDIVAVGATVALAPAIWTSPDGTTWRAVPTPDSFTGADKLNDVTAGPGAYVAVGRGDGPLAGAWVSADGTTWSPAHYSVSFEDTEMARVVWTGTTFLAMGRTGSGDGVAWVSTNGFDWTPLDTAAVFHGAPIVAGGQIGQRIVLFGQDAAGRIVVAWAAAP